MEAMLRVVCLLAGLLAVQAQCPPSWVKVENSCYRAFGQALTFNGAANACRQFVGCDGISPGHLACPTTFEERRVVRKLRFDLLQPLRQNVRMEEGQRLRPKTVWMGLRLGQGWNTTWESTEQYDNAAMDPYWLANRQRGPQMRPQSPAFNPTSAQFMGQCMTLPGQMQMPGVAQKWGYMPCNLQNAYICEISAPGTVNYSGNAGGAGGFNGSFGMGPGGQPGWNNPGTGGRWPGQGGARPGAGAGGWNPQGGAGGTGAGRWPNQGNPGQGGAGRWPNQGNPGQGGAGRWPNQGGAGGRPGAGAGGAGGWGGAGAGGAGAGAGGAGGWNPGAGGGNQPNQPGQRPPFNPRPRMYQGQALATP